MSVLETAVDACVLFNLCASGGLRRFPSSRLMRLHIPGAVADEAVSLQEGDDGDGATWREVPLQTYVAEGVLLPCGLQNGKETELYVDLARDLGDGEAMALAVAATRGWHLASDERKARRRASGLGVQVITTPEIMSQWGKADGISGAEMGRLIRNIQDIARFRPSSGFPCYEWWHRQARLIGET